jgi:hypothetical protein
MDLFSFTSIVVILIIIVGSYLIFTDSVQGKAKMILIAFVAIFGIMLLSSLSLFKSYFEINDSPIPGNAEYIVPSTKLGEVSERYSISTWIYINDWNTNFGSNKNILTYSRGEDGKEFSMNLDSNLNDLIIKVPVKTEGGSYTLDTINVSNISIQKWVNIIVCVDTNNTDVYINGKLVNSHVNSAVSASPSSQNNIIIAKANTGFNGSISGTRYYSKFLTPQEAWDIYRAGFSNSLLGSFMNRYNASIVFYKDRQKTNEVPFM